MSLPERPILCLVVERECSRRPVVEAVEAACRAGVDQVQIRERGLESKPLLEHADAIAQAARRGGGARPIAIVVNRRIDVALAIGAQGVHLGFDAMSIADARALLGPDARIGVSAHSVAEVEAAAREGASYAQLAPVFAPLSKSASRPPLGLSAVEAAAESGLPLLAQGGVEAHHCAGLLHGGAAGVAVTGSILMAQDPAAATAALRNALDAGREASRAD